MTIAGVATVYNEADIIDTTIRHLFVEGVDRVLVADASTDDTPDILRDLAGEFDLTVLRDDADHHFQPAWINRLAWQADSDWIIPFDADEFWYATEADTIKEALEAVPPGVTKLPARMFQHRDWEHRATHHAPFPKVAYRWHPTMRVANGNHAVDGPGLPMWGVLDLRELQFRSFDHMVEKSEARTVRLDPSLPETEGAHQRRLHAMSMDEKRREWARMMNEETVYDPIPSKVSSTVWSAKTAPTSKTTLDVSAP